MKSRVLILGNGISRLAYDAYIKAYKGEVWACNYAFREFPEIIARLTGHAEPLAEAQEWKEKHGYKYEIYTGPLAKLRPDWRLFTVGAAWCRDSGTTLAAQALHEGLAVDVLGFDLGGPDVYSREAYAVDKTAWVRRWVEIIAEWGAEKINFIGHDHKPFLLEVRDNPGRASMYAKRYKMRRPHLEDESYQKIHAETFTKKKNEIEKRLQVRFPNEYETEYRESIARLMASRGECEIIAEGKDK